MYREESNRHMLNNVTTAVMGMKSSMKEIIRGNIVNLGLGTVEEGVMNQEQYRKVLKNSLYQLELRLGHIFL